MLNLEKKNILEILVLHILHMLNFKELALIATERIYGKTSPETAMEPKTIPLAVFQKQARGNKTSFAKDVVMQVMTLTLHPMS